MHSSSTSTSSPWTLVGHEFVELKNTAAAVDAYRHAVDINAKDYRAWYGLGRTYEILAMPYYALFYYRKATALRPYDSRMWCANPNLNLPPPLPLPPTPTPTPTPTPNPTLTLTRTRTRTLALTLTLTLTKP